MNGSQIIVDALKQKGVEYVFGYPGGACIPIFDALFDAPELKFVLVRHEQGATHMADGYARATGKPGVVLVTSGPGATNTVTGLLTAQMDSIPMVVFTGQTVSAGLGKDAFQEADIFGITVPVVKYSYLVKDVNELPRIINEAFHLASTGRPGPVLIDLPKDIVSLECDPDADSTIDLPGYDIPQKGNMKRVVEAADLIGESKRPLIYAGAGVIASGASKVMLEFAEKINAPVTTSLLGKGSIPENHDLAVGMLGMHGTAYANKAVVDCDLIMAIGSRWDDRITGKLDEFCADAKKIHVDIDPAECGKVLLPDVFINGDAKLVLEDLTPHVHRLDTKQWVQQILDWKKEFPLHYPNGGLRVQHVLDELNTLLQGKDFIVSTDVGQHQMWAAQFLKMNCERQWISSGGAGTMGFGFPAAIGAQFAFPDKTVIAIVGDGGFQMTMPELATAQIHKLPVKILIMNNSYLGMVRQWQQLFFEDRLSGVDLEGNPDFVKVGEAYGIKGFHIRKPEEVIPVLQEALNYNEGPCIIEAVVNKGDNVFPMVPAGAPVSAMLIEDPSITGVKLSKPTGST